MENHGSQETIAATPASVRYVSFSHIRMPKFKIEKIFHSLKYRKSNSAQCQNYKRQIEILWSRYVFKFGQNIMIVLIISIDLIDVKVGIHPLT